MYYTHFYFHIPFYIVSSLRLIDFIGLYTITPENIVVGRVLIYYIKKPLLLIHIHYTYTYTLYTAHNYTYISPGYINDVNSVENRDAMQ